MLSEATLEDTPTWIVASVCSVIVLISLVFERALHQLGKALERRRVTLYEALMKLKEELMLLGFVSLLLVVFQDLIQKICIDESLMEHWRPCRGSGNKASAAAHYGASSTFAGSGRRMLKGGATFGHCLRKGKVPLLSRHALEQVHIFIFVLAITHVVFSAVTVLLGLLQMRKWKHWENSIQEEGSTAPKMIKRVQKIKFIQDRCKGREKVTWVIIWMRPFFKQFYGSVSNDDYVALRLGFVMEHFRGHHKFNFYDYMIKALEKDFKRVVGIKWYYWIFVMIFLLVNITAAASDRGKAGAHHKQAGLRGRLKARRWARGGGIVVRPSDELFWFHNPRLVLVLIHFILFQNAFEFAYFFWTLAMFGVNSCIMDRPGYSVSRIVICIVVQVLCSYSTLPLYAIVSHMGSSFKSAVFADDVADHLRGWADGARRRMIRRSATAGDAAGCLGAERSLEGRSRPGQLRSISF
ncbi:MLO-like protein 1 [Panicum miliaceum]|uniref:MLO-like protein n=1 Tax=Panicum miliaceum TaxID=4540 RepID=A0A3L6Q3U6_PANMI|nr:MLO-like protein 1 [Panicum miliaceum]